MVGHTFILHICVVGRWYCPRDDCVDDLDILRDGILFEDVVPVEFEEVVELFEDVESCFSGTRGSILKQNL